MDAARQDRARLRSAPPYAIAGGRNGHAHGKRGTRRTRRPAGSWPASGCRRRSVWVPSCTFGVTCSSCWAPAKTAISAVMPRKVAAGPRRPPGLRWTGTSSLPGSFLFGIAEGIAMCVRCDPEDQPGIGGLLDHYRASDLKPRSQVRDRCGGDQIAEHILCPYQLGRRRAAKLGEDRGGSRAQHRRSARSTTGPRWA